MHWSHVTSPIRSEGLPHPQVSKRPVTNIELIHRLVDLKMTYSYYTMYEGSERPEHSVSIVCIIDGMR